MTRIARRAELAVAQQKLDGQMGMLSPVDMLNDDPSDDQKGLLHLTSRRRR